MLPCSFGDASRSSWVSWTFTAKLAVDLTSEGRVHFQDPRNGRLKAFPFQGQEGNFSIRIDELQISDLGCYRCEKGNEFHHVQVELAEFEPVHFEPGEKTYTP